MELKTDVLVIGGGPSGVAAAIAAAREGADVLLAEKDGFFGGMSTGGLLNVWCGSASSDVWRDVCAGTTRERGGRTCYDPERLKARYIDLLEASGARMLLHAQLTGAEIENGCIRAAVFYGKSGPIRVSAKRFVDSTGDGDLARMAGVPFEQGRPSDGLTQPMSLEFMVGGVDDARAVYPTFGTHPDLERKMQEYVADGRILAPAGHVILLEGYEPGTACVNSTNVIRVDGTNELDLTRAELLTRRQIPQILQFLRDCVPGYENAWVVTSACHIGVRETRRFSGAYRLTEQDILDQRIFDDWVVSNASYPFGVHNPDGCGGAPDLPPYRGERYTIPYRCFLPEGCGNLLLNGRNISGTHLAHSSYRVMPICFAMGEAAGTAAALSLRENLPLRSVPAASVQRELLRFGVAPPAKKELETSR